MATSFRDRPRFARLMLVLPVLGLVLGSLGGAHYYIAKRFVLDPAWSEPLRSLALLAIAVFFVGSLLQPALERSLRPPWLRWASWPFVVWMGVFWISFNVLLLADAASWLMGAAGAGDSAPVTRALALGSLVLAACAAALRNGLRLPRVRRVEVQIAGWPERLAGFRIVQISDIHIGPILDGRFAAAVTRTVNALAPDLVAVTGDLVDGGVESLREDVAPFAGLRAPEGVFFVTGNHDVYSGDTAWVAHVAELGMRPLRNTRVRIGGEAGFDLAGVDDHRGDWVRGSSEDLKAALDGRDAAQPLVLLAHDPSTFKGARELGVDLQLSGHTHGGQIWPFALLVRVAVPYVAGLHRHGRSQLYVSRGTGFWGPPMRLLAPAEITEILIRPTPEAAGDVPL